MRKEELKRKSLAEFVQDRKRQQCKVCNLPKSIYAQLRIAGERRIHRNVVIEWLKTEHKITLTATELRSHYAAQHDEKE